MPSVNIPGTEGAGGKLVTSMMLAIFALALTFGVEMVRSRQDDIISQQNTLAVKLNDLSIKMNGLEAQGPQRTSPATTPLQAQPPQPVQMSAVVPERPLPAQVLVGLQSPIGSSSLCLNPVATDFRTLSRRVKKLEAAFSRAESDLRKTRAELQRMKNDQPLRPVTMSQ